MGHPAHRLKHYVIDLLDGTFLHEAEAAVDGYRVQRRVDGNLGFRAVVQYPVGA